MIDSSKHRSQSFVDHEEAEEEGALDSPRTKRANKKFREMIPEKFTDVFQSLGASYGQPHLKKPRKLKGRGGPGGAVVVVDTAPRVSAPRLIKDSDDEAEEVEEGEIVEASDEEDYDRPLRPTKAYRGAHDVMFGKGYL